MSVLILHAVLKRLDIASCRKWRIGFATTHQSRTSFGYMVARALESQHWLQTLAEKFKMNEDLAASFFFFRADANRNDGNRLIPTISLQLVQSFQGLDVFLEEKVVQHPNLFKETRQNQILGLLVEPLVRLSIKETDGMESDAATLRSHPRLVVIDGLDECHDIDTQCDLLRIIGTALPHLPYPIRFLITSRPESHITRIFQHDLKDVVRYDLSDDPDADKDIRRFLDKEFSEIRRSHPLRLELPSEWPPQRSISSIVERSSGHFIYASTVIRFIRSPRHRPDDRLEVIVGLKQPYEKDRPYARLDSLYAFIFHEIQDPAELETIYVALGIMHLRSQKCGIFLLPQLQRSSDRFWIETLLVLRPGDLSLLFDPLLSLVSFEEEDIRIFHKSLFDYLLDPSRSESLLLDLGLAHGVAANFLIRDKVIQDKWGTCFIQIQLVPSNYHSFQIRETSNILLSTANSRRPRTNYEHIYVS